MTEHTCHYYCDRPECIKRQRDELREQNEKMMIAVNDAIRRPMGVIPASC